MSRRARPVADAPVALLVAGSEVLAREWLVALIDEAPLAEASRLAGEGFAANAPALCEAAVRALADDEVLTAVGDDRGVAASWPLDGARNPPETITALELLRSVLWRAALDELHRPSAELVAALADRLATVMAAIAAAVLGAGERSQAQAVENETPEAHIGRRISEAGDRAITVVLAEIDGTDKLLAAENDHEARHAIDEAETAIVGLLRPSDRACREAPGRIWLTLNGSDQQGAQAIAHGIASTVQGASSHRGVPLIASVGVAVGQPPVLSPQQLIAAAEEELWAVRAMGPRGGPPREHGHDRATASAAATEVP